MEPTVAVASTAAGLGTMMIGLALAVAGDWPLAWAILVAPVLLMVPAVARAISGGLDGLRSDLDRRRRGRAVRSITGCRAARLVRLTPGRDLDGVRGRRPTGPRTDRDRHATYTRGMTATEADSATGPGSTGFRVEKDALGEVRVPADHYWGAQTQRSVENFRIGVGRFTWGRPVIRALGVLKLCAAQANLELGQLPADKVELIEAGGA